MENMGHIANSLAELKLEDTLEAVDSALKNGISADIILSEGLAKGLEQVGERFESKEYFLSDLVSAAYLMNQALELLKEGLKGAAAAGKSTGAIVIGTVEGDLHDIGKNILVSLLRASGFIVQDLGIDISSEKFVEAVRENSPDILALSALLVTTAPNMKKVIEALEESGLRDDVHVMIGGRATGPTFAKDIGADSYGKDALESVRLAKKIMGMKG